MQRTSVSIGLGLLVLIAILAGFISTLSGGTEPDLYPGEVVEERSCPYCEGREDFREREPAHPGRPRLDRCPACQGKGKLNVILPGPERPISIRGFVSPRPKYMDLKPGELMIEWVELKVPRYSPSGIPIEDPPEETGIIGAKISVTYAGPPTRREKNATGEWENMPVDLPEGYPTEDMERSYEMTSKKGGQFRLKLAAGTWNVTVEAPGYKPFERKLNLPFLTKPIWKTHATLIGSNEAFGGEPETPREISILLQKL